MSGNVPDELYDLSANAKDDLRNIYRFGLDRFGEAQADLYLAELLEYLIGLGLHPSSAPVIDELPRRPRRGVYKSNAVFYDYILAEPIRVRRILSAQDTAAML